MLGYAHKSYPATLEALAMLLAVRAFFPDAQCGTISANMGSILQYRISQDSSDDK